jgi:hypothetical protein
MLKVSCLCIVSRRLTGVSIASAAQFGVAHTDTAANYDGTQSASPFSDVASALTKSETYKRVVKTLMGEGLSADAAWTAIHRLERKESIGW